MNVTRYLAICTFLLCILNSTFCQSNEDAFSNGNTPLLKIKDGFFGYKIYQNAERISKVQLFEIFNNSNHSELIDQFNYGRTSYNVGYVIGMPAGFILGWELGNFIFDKDVNTKLLWVSGAVAFCSITLSSYGLYKMNKTVKTWADLPNDSDISLHLGGCQNGIGFTLIF